jgi:integrase
MVTVVRPKGRLQTDSNFAVALSRVDGNSEYYFWSGVSKPKSAVGDYQRALHTLFDLTKTPRVHRHLFRHTFATDLLTHGRSLETVAALRGHGNTRALLLPLG